MDYFIVFVKDISGVWYVLYILACLFFIFLLLGIVGDRKRAVIAERLKMKKAFDIASGKEAKIAAMETKQVLDVFSNPVVHSEGSASNVSGSPQENLEQNVETAPSVLTIDANGNSPIPVERRAVSNPNLGASPSTGVSVSPVQNTNENPVSTQNIQS